MRLAMRLAMRLTRQRPSHGLFQGTGHSEHDREQHTPWQIGSRVWPVCPSVFNEEFASIIRESRASGIRVAIGKRFRRIKIHYLEAEDMLLHPFLSQVTDLLINHF